jgi:hypothetical protein
MFEHPGKSIIADPAIAPYYPNDAMFSSLFIYDQGQLK